MSDAVLFERSGHVVTITLNRPERRNAMSVAMLEAFRDGVTELADDDDVRAIVVTGAGKGFSSGADFQALGAWIGQSDLSGPLAVNDAIGSLYEAFLVLDKMRVPTIAAINGAAVGGGLGLALLCDIRIIAEDAKIGGNFARLGIHPGMAISQLLPEAVGYETAAELLFTGRLIRGSEAVAKGLALRAVPKDEVLTEAQALAAEIAQSAPLAVRWIKRTLRNVTGRNLDRTLQAESMAQTLLMQSNDAQEGIKASLSRRLPEFEGK
jgi:enoyl-CoA hydratase/carnithine racemase